LIFILDDFNKVALNVEFNKLVPTPQTVPQPATDLNGDGDTLDPGEPANDGTAKANNDYRGIGWTSGVFKSFGDAPDGFSEELKEVTYAVGAEYISRFLCNAFKFTKVL
jgi:hypothetical protein